MNRSGKPLRLLVLYASEIANSTLSYQRGWPRAFGLHPAISASFVNLANSGPPTELYLRWLLTWRRFDGIVLLHSVFSNVCYLLGRIRELIGKSRIPKALFMGNEHKQIPEKIAFAKELEVSLLITMLHHPRAVSGYASHVGCEVVAIPSAGVEPELFSSTTVEPASRIVDIGYRAFDAPPYLGHRERSEIAARIGDAARARGMKCDISLDPADRFDEVGWINFLSRCVGQIGTEAGGDYLDFDDSRRLKVIAALSQDPNTPFEVLRDRFFSDGPADGAGRALSGRISEAAAAGCVQILLAGEYAGYFRGGEHFIELAHDFSNLENCLDQFADPEVRARLAMNAKTVATESLSYWRLIDKFLSKYTAICGRQTSTTLG